MELPRKSKARTRGAQHLRKLGKPIEPKKKMDVRRLSVRYVSPYIENGIIKSI